MRHEFNNSQNWHSRGYIPHYEADHKYQFITYRLADSLPNYLMAKVSQFDTEQGLNTTLGAPLSDAAKGIGTNSKSNYSEAPLSDAAKARHRRLFIENILDKSYGSCLLKIPEVAEQVISSWKYFDQEKYDLIAYTVMPNHVHLLIKVYPNQKIGNLVRSWKLFTTNFVLNNDVFLEAYLSAASESGTLTTEKDDSIRHAASESGAPSSIESAASESGAPSSIESAASESGAPSSIKSATAKNGTPNLKKKFSIWQREYWDRFIRDQNHFNQTIQYIHHNPVKAKLTDSKKDWPWSDCYFKP
ncbi:MAG: transposase [Lentisphaerales bacterium]|nr:transposase [Lentisphaerales bacterium]